MPTTNLDQLDPKKYIIIKGSRVNNLKNLSVAIPRNQMVVITGLSGSGKSSLAFDTLYAEGQRRYVESLSSYARQFLGRMSKPEVDYIKGIAPAIAIEQKVNSRNPRSTVGTSTEIYEYMKLLFARIGKTYSPVSGNLVMRHSVTDVVDFVTGLPKKERIMITCPLIMKTDRSLKEQLTVLMQQGFTRILVNHETKRIDELTQEMMDMLVPSEIDILIDRMAIGQDEDLASRVADSVQTAFYEGEGTCYVDRYLENGVSRHPFSNRFELDGITFEEPSANLFSFNNPYGACKTCEGFGNVIGIDEDLVVPDKSLSVYEGAIACWKGEKMSEWKDELIRHAHKFDFPVHRAYYDLTPKEKALIWEGNQYFGGINQFFKSAEEQSYKIQYRVMISRYRGKTVCPDCQGTRLRKDANYVEVAGKSIVELVLMPVENLLTFFKDIELEDHDMKVAKRLLIEAINRIQFLCDVGLGYLTLNRLSNTLSGGESQRINLATSLGSSLVGSMYILDEPSIGLHSRDTKRLIKVLRQLRDLGNTVIIVEHDEEIIRAADQIIDIGPMAGVHGGELVFQGTFDEIIKEKHNLTGDYLRGARKVVEKPIRRKWKDFIEVSGARENNLKNITVKFPLKCLVAVTGVSGSGKTSLVKTILYPSLKKIFGGYNEKTGKHDRISGDYKLIQSIELIDQNPIGRSSRSNPATYVKAYDDIRQLYSEQPISKLRGYKPGYFSFNIEGGRCEECEGEGVVKIEMQFMADIFLKCDSCHGKRFKDEVLDVSYREKNIAEILDLTIDEAITFFGAAQNATATENRIVQKLQPLADVGLGYLKLGQASSTLSGGEAQRVKLAFFLAKGNSDVTTLFIFDEPTTGLHFHDIQHLLTAFNALIERGHSIIVIEHNLDVVYACDWVIDLGPEGGEKGGNLLYEGTPEKLAECKESYTGKYLKETKIK
jgi:excinuclease ABC subunit A